MDALSFFQDESSDKDRTLEHKPSSEIVNDIKDKSNNSSCEQINPLTNKPIHKDKNCHDGSSYGIMDVFGEVESNNNETKLKLDEPILELNSDLDDLLLGSDDNKEFIVHESEVENSSVSENQKPDENSKDGVFVKEQISSNNENNKSKSELEELVASDNEPEPIEFVKNKDLDLEGKSFHNSKRSSSFTKNNKKDVTNNVSFEDTDDLHTIPKKRLIERIMDGDEELENTLSQYEEGINNALNIAVDKIKKLGVSAFSFLQYSKIKRKFKKGDVIVSGDFKFLRYHNELMLYKYSGNKMALMIPSFVGNLPVRYVDCGFLSFLRVRSIANSMSDEKIASTTVEDLKQCSGNVRSVKLPNTLVMLPKKVFRGCKNLEVLIVPDSVNIVHPKAFNGCGLKEIYFEADAPANLEYCKLNNISIYCKKEYLPTFYNILENNSRYVPDYVNDVYDEIMNDNGGDI